jgi:hypothetical protein
LSTLLGTGIIIEQPLMKMLDGLRISTIHSTTWEGLTVLVTYWLGLTRVIRTLTTAPTMMKTLIIVLLVIWLSISGAPAM